MPLSCLQITRERNFYLPGGNFPLRIASLWFTWLWMSVHPIIFILLWDVLFQWDGNLLLGTRFIYFIFSVFGTCPSNQSQTLNIVFSCFRYIYNVAHIRRTSGCMPASEIFSPPLPEYFMHSRYNTMLFLSILCILQYSTVFGYFTPSWSLIKNLLAVSYIWHGFLG